MSKCLDWFYLENEVKNIDEEVPLFVYVFKNRIEIETATLRKYTFIYGNKKEIPFEEIEWRRKKFDYKDLILMNETLNKIMGNQK